MRYRYRTDEEMKDSGVEWIGKIPKDWEVVKFKYSSLLYTGNSIKDNEKDNYTDSENSYPYISTKDINIDYNTINYNNGMYTKIDDKTFKIANKDSILICIEGGSAGRKISYLNQNVSFVNKLCCIQSSKINSKFQYYYCNSDSFKREFSLNMSGLIGGVSVSALNNFRLVNPSLLEQEKIANFLDEKTLQFDFIISKKEELIKKLDEAKKSLISEVVTGKVKVVKTDDGYELVKRKRDEMKDSGVEWLGEIPKDWEVKKLNQFAELTRLAGAEYTSYWETDDEGEIIALRGQNIGENELNLTNIERISIELSNKLKRSKLYKGDIVFPCVGTIGKATLIKEDNKYHINQNIAKVTYNDNIIPELLSYLLNSNECHKQITWFNSSQMQPSVLIRDLRQFKFAISINKLEQIQISSFLELRLKSMSYLLNNTKLQIKKLKEAKQSLISEAVTGKIEILD